MMSSARSIKCRRRQSGFTIIELLIATGVFSVVLLVVTTGVMVFTSDYYKGINQTNTQTVARNLANTIAQSLQFSGTKYPVQNLPSAGNTQGLCVGNVRYSYVIGREVEAAPDSSGLQTKDALVVHTFNSPLQCDSTPLSDITSAGYALPAGDKELLSQHMWLGQLIVTPLTSDSYSISTLVAYGDPDLLCSASTPSNTCQGSGTMPAAYFVTYGSSLKCKNQTGSQFCATSAISTTAQQRL